MAAAIRNARDVTHDQEKGWKGANGKMAQQKGSRLTSTVDVLKVEETREREERIETREGAREMREGIR